MTARKKVDGEERRASRRLEVALAILVSGRDIHGNAFSDSTSSYDVSRQGASFVTKRELALGQEVSLIIPRRRPPRGAVADFETTGAVRRIAAHGPGAWEVGVEFTGPRLRTYFSENT
ncbi:MAG: PilZ domain-containing protein [Terriglobia bacterium]